MSQWDIYSESALNGDFELQESFDFSCHPESFAKIKNKTLESVLPTQGWPKAEISEINCSHSDSVLQLLLPTLAKLNAQNRWISLISPPGEINPKIFAHYGIDMSKVLLIHPKNDVDDKVTMNKALKNGTSGIVILWAEQLNKRYLAQWRKSVKQGNSTGIIVNMSRESSCSNSVALSFSVSTVEESLQVNNINLFGIRQPQRSKILFSKTDLTAIADQHLLQKTQKTALN